MSSQFIIYFTSLVQLALMKTKTCPCQQLQYPVNESFQEERWFKAPKSKYPLSLFQTILMVYDRDNALITKLCIYGSLNRFKKHSMTFDALFASCFVPSTCFQLGREEIAQSENRQDRQTQEVIMCVFCVCVRVVLFECLSLLGLHRYRNVHIRDSHRRMCDF